MWQLLLAPHLDLFLFEAHRRTGPVPVAPGRLQLPYHRSSTQSAVAVWEGSREHRRRKRPLVQDSQGILLPSLLSHNFPSDRMVSEDTGDGGGGPISSPIWQPPPPLRPPLGLLPEPHRARVKGVYQRAPRGGGGLPVVSPNFASSSDSRSRDRYMCAP